MKQLCWNCKNTNRFKCEWFEDCSKFPDYVKTTYNKHTRYEYIIACDKYEPIDCKYFKSLTNREIALVLGISERCFYRHKQKYLKIFYKKYPPTHCYNFNK